MTQQVKQHTIKVLEFLKNHVDIDSILNIQLPDHDT